MNDKVDIIIPWVDDSDEQWISQKNYWATKTSQNDYEKSNVRFQSWDNLQYWFRAVENNMPWFNKIFFVTVGHIPRFLKKDHPRLVIVRHDSYIPNEYLPTFNVNTIEMNFHRIDELSENFIYFNDDTFPLLPIPEEYFFRDNMVCDEAVENIITTTSFGAVSHTTRYAQVNNMFIINKYFKKREVQKKNPEKWFCEEYGDRLERTNACKYWYDFPGFYDPHMANALKKSTLAHLWEIEHDALDTGSKNKFRGYSDVTQYLIRYWQLCTGDFVPRKTEGKVFFPDINTYDCVVDAIRNGSYPMISFNENCTPEEFEIIKKAINSALEQRFPNKSSFEE